MSVIFNGGLGNQLFIYSAAKNFLLKKTLKILRIIHLMVF